MKLLTYIFVSNDIKPGLANKEIKRKITVEKKHKELNQKNQTKSKQVLEHEVRKAGLDKAISHENKGFALLAKMGYKPGMSIGKKGDGRAEPVPIELRAGRTGLGVESERKRRAEEMSAMRARMMEKRAKLSIDYRSRQQEKAQERFLESDLKSSQRVCYQLDSQEEIEEPEYNFYWPEAAFLKSDDGDEQKTEDEEKTEENSEENDVDEVEDFLPVSEKLEYLTSYLRTTYQYCLWCGTKYEDEDDLNQNCPGGTRAAHDE